MSNDEACSSTYCFGPYELQAGRRELLHHGQPVAMEPKVFDLLVVLVRHHTRVVSKDELLATVWPGTFVSETALTRCVMKARKALGDDSQRQHSIKTLHGRGYRFVGSMVDRPTPGDAHAAAPAHTLAMVASPSSRGPLWLGAIASMVLGAAMLWGVLRLLPAQVPTALPSMPSIAVLPVYNDSGDGELDWSTYGLMDVLASQLQSSGGLQVASSRDVIRVVGRDELGAPDGVQDTLTERLRTRLGVTHVLAAALEQPGQLYRLHARLYVHGQRGREFELMGGDPMSLIAQLRRSVMAQLVGPEGPREAARIVSEDGLVNENYARGRDQMLRGRLDEALELLQSAATREPGNFWVRHALANTILNMGDAQRAAQLLTRLMDEAQAKGDLLQQAQAAFTLGTTHLRLDDMRQARSKYEEALAIYETLDLPYEQARTLTNLAIAVGEHHDYDRERGLLERAARAFEAAGLEQTPGRLLGGLGNNALDRGNLEDAETYFRKALEAFLQEGQQNVAGISYFSLSRVAQYRGDFPAALTLAEQALRIANDIGPAWARPTALRRKAEVLVLAGEFNAAEAAYAEALELSTHLGAASEQAATLSDLAELARQRGHHEEATMRLAQSQALAEQIQDPIGLLTLRNYRGRLALARGRTEEAIVAAEQALAEAQTIPPFAILAAHQLKGRALLAQGDLAGAEASLASAYRLATQRADRVERAQLAAELGSVQLRANDRAAALTSLSLAREAVPTLFRVLVLDAELAAAEGEQARALGLMDQAKAKAKARWTAGHEAQRISWLATQAASVHVGEIRDQD